MLKARRVPSSRMPMTTEAGGCGGGGRGGGCSTSGGECSTTAITRRYADPPPRTPPCTSPPACDKCKAGVAQARAACGRALCGSCLAAALQWRVAREGLPLLIGSGQNAGSPPPPPLVVVGLSGGPASRALWSLLSSLSAAPAHDPSRPPPSPRLRLVAVHVDEGVYGEGAESLAEEARAAAAAAWAAAGVPSVEVAGLEPSPPARPRVAAFLAAAGPRGRARLVRALVRAALVRAAVAHRSEGGGGGGGRAVVALGTTVTTAAARVVAAAAAGAGLELAAEAAPFDAGPPGLRTPLICPALGAAAKDAAMHCRLAGLGLPALPVPPSPAARHPTPSRSAAAEASIAFDFVDRAVGRSRTSAASMVGAAARFAAPGTGADAGAAAAAGARAPCWLCAAPLEGADVGREERVACFACRETVLGDGGDAAGVWEAAPVGGVWGAGWLGGE